jgi:serine/threonine-protein kinase HipA
MTDSPVRVHVDLNGLPRFVGRLWTRTSRGKESASFEYDASWLRHPDSFGLEPALPAIRGSFHTPAGQKLFGALGDSAPDTWGRTLLRRAERHRALEAKRTPRALNEIDFLLGVHDETRQGALRFSRHEGGPFLADALSTTVPPLVRLPELLNAAGHLEAHEDRAEDLQLLLAPGSSLGGARPKASVRNHDGSLAIAKFPSLHDEYDMVRWEKVALALARRCGIRVPEAHLHAVAGRQVLVIARFDRNGTIRIPYLSAMSMLQATDGDRRSYVEIADLLREHGAATTADLPQLWRRLAFNIMISNSDDHLRNHGFLYDGRNGWRLSPAFDMNPVPRDIRPHELTTSIDADGDPAASVEIALSVARQFNLNNGEASAIVSELDTVLRTWRTEGARHGLKAADLDRMASAFS